MLAPVNTHVPNIHGSCTVPFGFFHLVSNEGTSGEKRRSLHTHLLFLFSCVSGRVEGRDPTLLVIGTSAVVEGSIEKENIHHHIPRLNFTL